MSTFYFISTLGPGWGGCEELWSRAAIVLAGEGHRVLASVAGAPVLHPKVEALRAAGIEVMARANDHSWPRRLERTLLRSPAGWSKVAREFMDVRPDLVVVSMTDAWPPLELAEGLASSRMPFVTIAQVNHDRSWPENGERDVLDRCLRDARKIYFVAHGNRRLAEIQLGRPMESAEVVCNPWTVSPSGPLPWPMLRAGDALRLACVGRLSPVSKGQDLLLLALSGKAWQQRAWHLSFFGDGPQRDALKLMTARLGLDDKVSFEGHVEDICSVWAQNHALALMSRYEGTPLVLLEAAVCGRPAVMTAVDGNAEVVKDGVTGFLAATTTVDAVADALERMWAKRGELQSMGVEARKQLLAAHPVPPELAFARKLKRLVGDGEHDRPA